MSSRACSARFRAVALGMFTLVGGAFGRNRRARLTWLSAVAVKD